VVITFCEIIAECPQRKCENWPMYDAIMSET